MTERLFFAGILLVLGVLYVVEQPALSQQRDDRYSVSSSDGIAYVVNVSTGAVRYCDKGHCFHVSEQLGTVKLPE
ncbi:hypothetical protein [Pelagibius sp. Alg239-R121]|uniref:hypothetical protein n=1 Tax=Pelagibius sp. Alg239-R121 TaxID=2993448 RepID=UPI0024A636B3|nr:hypothetical protein [Pelagibius sp. Alg239-R121]